MKKLLIVPLALTSGALVAAHAPAALSHQTANILKITAPKSGLRFGQNKMSAKAGRIQLVFTNLSPLHHNVRIELGEHELGGTKTIGHGTTTALVVLKRGAYHFYCSVPGHEDAGMSGRLIVS